MLQVNKRTYQEEEDVLSDSTVKSDYVKAVICGLRRQRHFKNHFSVNLYRNSFLLIAFSILHVINYFVCLLTFSECQNG